jgi:AmmeMemoRadiSam system protein A
MRSPEDVLGATERAALLALARASIEHGLEAGEPLVVDALELPPALRVRRAVFVTLHAHGALRGCLGELAPSRALGSSVAWHAWAAAFRDPRFPALSSDELDALEIHVSVLGPLEPIAAATAPELLAALRPGLDGLVVEDGPFRATFLPAVWESLPEPHDFLDALVRKAGLPPGHWSATTRAYRYHVEAFGERDIALA